MVINTTQNTRVSEAVAFQSLLGSDLSWFHKSNWKLCILTKISPKFKRKWRNKCNCDNFLSNFEGNYEMSGKQKSQFTQKSLVVLWQWFIVQFVSHCSTIIIVMSSIVLPGCLEQRWVSCAGDDGEAWRCILLSRAIKRTLSTRPLVIICSEGVSRAMG